MPSTTKTPPAEATPAPAPDPRTVARDSTDNPDNPDPKQTIGGVLPDNVLLGGKSDVENVFGADDIRRNLTEHATAPLLKEMTGDLKAGLTQPEQEDRLTRFETRYSQMYALRLKLDPNEQAVERPKHADDLLAPALEQTAQTKKDHAIWMAASPADPGAIRALLAELKFLRDNSKPLRTRLKMIDARISNLEQQLYKMGEKAFAPVASAFSTNAVLNENLALLEKLLRGDAQQGVVRRKENDALRGRTREETIAEMTKADGQKDPAAPETKVSVSTTPTQTPPGPAPATPATHKPRTRKKKP